MKRKAISCLLLLLASSAPAFPLLRPLRATQIAVGVMSSCALLETKQVKCWGSNQYGALGIPGRAFGPERSEVGPVAADHPTINFGTGRHVKFLASGEKHLCVILDNDRVKCWGSNFHGELGIPRGERETVGRDRGFAEKDMGDDLPYLDIGEKRRPVSIVMGFAEHCILFDDASVTCWRLGKKQNVTFGAKKPEAITMGMNHYCALLDDGSVACWGRNDDGQLGRGDAEWTAREGDAVVTDTIDLGRGRTAKKISAMKWSTCALLDDATVKCWGSNVRGELATGDTLSRGRMPNETGDNLKPIDLGNVPIVDLSCGPLSRTCCALFMSGAMKCWGANSNGVLGLEDTRDRGGKPGDLGEELPFLNPGRHATIRQIAPGDSHTCALLDAGGVKCWGSNLFGVLGSRNARVQYGQAPGTMGDRLPYVPLGWVYGSRTTPPLTIK